jgi:hypothetical protein
MMKTAAEHRRISDAPDPTVCAKVLRQLEESPNPEAIWSAYRAELITEDQVFRLLPEPPQDDTLFLIVRDGVRALLNKIPPKFTKERISMKIK